MTSAEALYDTLKIDVENIGGINETSVELESGVTILEGKNATNRTSFLQAVMAAMGSDQFNLKGDAAYGRVRLTLDETVVEREFNRRNGVVESTDEAYLHDPELANLFAFLLEDNEARRAVARSEDLREIITRPIDTDEINAEIERLQTEKQEIDEQLQQIENRERDLVDLEQRKNRLETEVEKHKEQLTELETEIDAADTNLQHEQDKENEIEEKLNELKECRSELDDIRFRLETAEETIDSLQTERQEKQDRRENLTVDPERDVGSLRDKLDDLREQKRRINAQLSELQSVIQFNEDMLDGTDSELADVLADESDANDNASVTDQLLADEETVVCWTCGSEVARRDIEATLERLQSFRQEKQQARHSVQDDIETTKKQVEEHERAQTELEQINHRLGEIDEEIEEKRRRIDDLESRRDELHDETEALEETVERERTDDYSEVLDLHTQANTVELELDQKEEALASVEDEIAEIESLLDDREMYEERRDRITDELEELRNRIDRLERDAIDEFNSHMEAVLSILEYENIARIWIERRERETRRGRRNVTESYFELHVVRESESGQTYEGTVDTLSESEREVVGLVFALAGYLVHDLYETVPVMLLDSLEAIDSDRIARLVDYFADIPEFLIVALLPEDANAIEVDHDRVTEI